MARLHLLLALAFFVFAMAPVYALVAGDCDANPFQGSVKDLLRWDPHAPATARWCDELANTLSANNHPHCDHCMDTEGAKRAFLKKLLFCIKGFLRAGLYNKATLIRNYQEYLLQHAG